MALNNFDSSKIEYQAKIEWYKKRTAEVTSGAYTMQDYLAETNNDFEAQKHTADELIQVLNDLITKCKSLNGKIDYLSSSLSIPIDPAKDPDVSSIVKSLDPNSGGTYLSYLLYSKIISQKESSYSSINLDSVISELTGNPLADSNSVYNNIVGGYSSSTKSNNSSQSSVGSILDYGNVDSSNNQVLTFANNFLNNSSDPSYIPWSFRQDIGTEIKDAAGLVGLWSFFSSNSGASSSIIGGVGDGVPLTMDSTLHDLTTRCITNLNQFLDQTNVIMDFQWATDLLCCLTHWFINLDTKTLQGIRTLLNLLQISLNFDFMNMLSGIEEAILNIFKGIMMNEMMNIILQIIQKITDPIKSWINSLEGKLFDCLPIKELINVYLNAAIRKVEKLLLGLVENFFKNMQLKNIKNGTKVTISAHKKEIGELIRLIDSVIHILEAASKCGIDGAPSGETASQVVQDYNINNPNTYVFPIQSNPTVYNSFPIGATTSSTMSPSSAPNASSSSSSSSSLGAAISKGSPCLSKIPSDQIEGVKEWINTINSMSKGAQ